MIKKAFLSFFVLIGVAFLISCGQNQEVKDLTVHFAKKELSIVTQSGEIHDFVVELADTDQKRQQGLMFRKTLEDNKGMLFIFDEIAQRSFWMKNTYIFLDMVFIDQNNQIVKIHPMARPHDLTPINSSHPIKAMIELKGGVTQSLGIHPRDHVKFSW